LRDLKPVPDRVQQGVATAKRLLDDLRVQLPIAGGKEG